MPLIHEFCAVSQTQIMRNIDYWTVSEITLRGDVHTHFVLGRGRVKYIYHGVLCDKVVRKKIPF